MTYTKISRIYNDINESSNPNPDPGTIDLQSKSIEITENGNSIITADPNYDGLRSVNLSVNVPINTFIIPEYDVNLFKFAYHYTTAPQSHYYSKYFDPSRLQLYKSDGNVGTMYPYICQINYTIVLAYGNPPLNSYYCIEDKEGRDYNIYYNNNIIASLTANFNCVSIFGILINSQENLNLN